MTRVLAPAMAEKKNCNIIVISSVAGAWPALLFAAMTLLGVVFSMLLRSQVVLQSGHHLYDRLQHRRRAFA